VVNILIKAMLATPYPDFRLGLSLLGEAPIATDPTPLTSKKHSSGEQADGAEGKAEGEKEGEDGASEKEPVQYLAGNVSDPLILRLATLASLLQSSRFRQFWKLLYSDDEYDDVRGYTSNVARFEEDVRKVVIEAVGSTFKRIGEERLAGYLNLKVGKEMDEFIDSLKEEGWSFEKDGESGKRLVVAPVNADNEIKAVTVNEDRS
jgi:translation initiation factor 3 subunit K